MFDQVLAQIESQLDIPYPHRTLVIQELEADMWAQYTALREAGMADADAREATLREMALDDDALASLEAIHSPAIRRVLKRLPTPAREPIEWLCASLPLVVCIYFLIVEVPMSHFIRQGGFGMWPIMFLAAAALLLQLRRAFSWFVQRDHSRIALARNTSTPLYLAAATMLMGITATATNFYVVLSRWTDGQFPDGVESAKVGFAESVTSVMLAGGLAALIVLVQAALQTGLRAMQVKVPPSAS